MPSSPATQSTAETGGARFLSDEEMQKLKAKDKQLQENLNSRLPATGNPEATIADPFMTKVVPRYDLVQNQSDKMVIIPDLKTNVEDMGLVLEPGQFVKLTDFYSPQEINRSKGLRFAATKMPGVDNNPALIPLNSEAEASLFKVPERVKHNKGDIFEDPNMNDFDRRFEELEMREARAEEKLTKKSLAGRFTKSHGKAPASL